MPVPADPAYAALLEKYPDNKQTAAAALAMTALALLEQGKHAEAVARAEMFLKNPGSADSGQRLLDVKAIRAEALLAQGKHAAAAEAYRELIAGNATAAQRPAWQLREGVALAAGKQWPQLHAALSAAAPGSCSTTSAVTAAPRELTSTLITLISSAVISRPSSRHSRPRARSC
jgi:tetratricopeptide (TPR) repeat protein